MSSNIKVQRICQHCGNQFTARTTVTKYCGDTCAKRAYKARLRAIKVQKSNNETQKIIEQPIQELKSREFLSVTQVAKLIGCSRQNVYNLINTGRLKATNILIKKTIIKRSDLDLLFNPTQPEIVQPQVKSQPIVFNIADYYNLTEIQNKYGISEKALQEIIKRNNIPKIKKGWFAYVPKDAITKLLN